MNSSTAFKPKAGPADGAKATCPKCRYTFPIARTVQKGGAPPRHRLYAKLVLRPDGSKAYLPIDDYDLALYEEAASLLGKRKEPYPLVRITPGYNTDQVLNYGYTHWYQMFNDRQLLCLSLLGEPIRTIPDERVRGLFACLFSGSLEFNNMFASFKGEGTGAVRHMFAHHILKPERTPLEANVWGTPKSSGAFSTLFQSRVLRALDYRESPFEVRVLHANGKLSGEKIHGLSCKLGHDTTNSFADFVGGKDLYLSCGDSATTDLDAESVDAVVTDPPFFDNVHYSQLADFFYVWQRHILGANGYQDADSTRSPAEVQQSDPAVFVERLTGVWTECHRVLRPDGLLVFTYHHSRAEGWRSILEAVVTAGFGVVAAHPIKAEMSVAAPKHQAKSPIDLDVILVCRKQTSMKAALPEFSVVLDRASQAAIQQVARFNGVGRRLGRNDVRVVLMPQVVRLLSSCSPVVRALDALDTSQPFLVTVIDQIHDGQRVAPRPTQDVGTQLQLW